MKKIAITLICLIVAAVAFSQTLTQSKADSIAMVGNAAMKAQAAKYKYYQPTQAGISSLIDASTACLTSQFNRQTFLQQPPTDTPGAYVGSAALNLRGVSFKTYTGLKISGGGIPCITLTGCHDIHITSCYLQNSSTVGIYLINCYNITIDYNYITNVSTGVYAVTCTGGIAVNNNQGLNMMGPYPRGQFSQFNNCTGAGNSVNNNIIENILGKSHPEDVINFYHSFGTAASPIQCNGNKLRGGGPSASGGGINLGDNGGSYQSASNNILVNPGQYGMAISGGDHMSLVNNQIFSAQLPFSNVGITVWSQKGDQPTIPKISSATVSGNRVYWFSGRPQYIGLNPYWIGDSGLIVTGLSTNTWNDKTITAAILQPTILTIK